MNVPERVLWAYAGGALEPGRVVEVEAALRSSAALRTRLSVVSAELAGWGEPAPDPWRMPPAGVAHRGFGRVRQEAVGVMGPVGVRPGDRRRIVLDADDPPADAVVVVLWRGDGPWEVLLPRVAAQVVPLGRLPRDPAGHPYLDVRVRPDASVQRWSVALMPEALLPAFGEGASWEAAQRAILAGELPVATLVLRLG